MNKYPHLFEPIQIGTQTVKNRVFMPPISTDLAMRMMEKGIRIEAGAKVGNIKDAITAAWELAGEL